MIKKIYVKWYLKRQENRYFILDFQYEDIENNLGENYEEVDVDENIIKIMMEVNDENITYCGHYRTQEQFNENIDTLLEDEEIGPDVVPQWDGPGFYVLWGDIEDGTICPALEALDVEYDIALQNGEWISWLTGWSSESITDTDTLKDCLMDLYGCEIDQRCEELIEESIAGYFDEGEYTSENNIELGMFSEKVSRILNEAEAVGRIDPANLP